jgi:hypothetical protein
MQTPRDSLARLEAAISRLDEALLAREAAWARSLDASRGAEAEAKGRVEAVAARLDVAIGRLQSVLEE